MALGWLTVLKAVPWGEVIGNAPKVADGAKKLWNSVARKPPPEPPAEAEAAAAQAPQISDRDAIAALQARVAATEAAATDLHGQMLASSELIQALADQHTQMIRRLETLRARLRWLAVATAVLAAAGVAGFAWLLRT